MIEGLPLSGKKTVDMNASLDCRLSTVPKEAVCESALVADQMMVGAEAGIVHGGIAKCLDGSGNSSTSSLQDPQSHTCLSVPP